jgi:hypothetical protein
VQNALRNAVKATHKKNYDKSRHAPAILSRLSPDGVRLASTECDRMFRVIMGLIAAEDKPSG